ncbi:MAG TPA: hypothetical protein VHG30_14115 [Microvirga sp.]|nr:hypothetical protein [Microvirga sp.]
MKLHGPFEQRSLIRRAAVQERVAGNAAEVARAADRAGQAASADVFWTIARRSRVQALKLRAEAGAHKASPKGMPDG